MKSVLRIFLCCFGAILFVTFSCEDQSKVDSNKGNSSQNEGTLAIVTTKFLEDGCEVLLEIQENGKKVMLLPIDLEDQYKVDGIQLLITFHASRIMQSICQIGRPIVIEKVELIG